MSFLFLVWSTNDARIDPDNDNLQAYADLPPSRRKNRRVLYTIPTAFGGHDPCRDFQIHRSR